MSAYRDASPVERFKISKIAIKRWHKTKGSDAFRWSDFVVLREQVAQELSRPSWRYRIAALLYARLGKFLEKNKPKN